MDKQKIEDGVRLLLEGIGEDLQRDGIKSTPTRVADMYGEIFHFFEHIFKNDIDLTEIISANYSFINSSLNKHYALDHQVSSTFKQVIFNNAPVVLYNSNLYVGASFPIPTNPALVNLIVSDNVEPST